MIHRTLRFFSFIFVLVLVGCAYQFGYVQRHLPGGYKQVAIPVFMNKTQEVGVETYFTNSLVEEFGRSQVAKVRSRSSAPVFLTGTVEEITMEPTVQVKGAATSELTHLPSSAILTTQYRVIVKVTMRLLRSADKKTLWKSHFTNERIYSAPQIGLPEVNSANAIYNHSAKHQTIALIAEDMMVEAHDRLTERF